MHRWSRCQSRCEARPALVLHAASVLNAFPVCHRTVSAAATVTRSFYKGVRILFTPGRNRVASRQNQHLGGYFMLRRTVLAGLGAAALPVANRVAHADDSPGATATELKIGNTAAYSGPASAYG